MLDQLSVSPTQVAEMAGEAAALMKALSNEHRLLILCHLTAAGELTAGQLVQRIGPSQSALSQHLAKLRGEGLVGYRREAQTLFYRVTDERAGQVLSLLQDIFCPELIGAEPSGDSRMAATHPSTEKKAKGARDGRAG